MRFHIAPFMVLVFFGAFLIWPVAYLVRERPTLTTENVLLVLFSYLVVFVFYTAYLVVRSELRRRGDSRSADEPSPDPPNASDPAEADNPRTR